jgi:ribonucleoside-diphosphate reductase alpha chain
MKELKSVFKRFFTQELEKDNTKTVYDLFNWKKVDVLIKDYKSGRTIVDMKDLEFPEQYSQNACDIIASKYFRRAGVPNEAGYENSMKLVAHRMVNFWCQALIEEKLITTDDQAKIFYDEMVYGLLSQMYAPNSPQWFNTGLAQSYGITGECNDTFYFDLEQGKVMKSKDSYSRTQASACFILSIQDKLLGDHSISEQFVTETKLFKGGSGTGTNFSTIRAAGESLSSGGYSSGLMSFLRGLDRNAGAIKSGGTTRRAAKMVCLDIDHPEIEDFISWKSKEEDKVRALVKMGYDSDFDGEAYLTVSGQNSNNSVRISDDFMNKVENLSEDPEAVIELKGRVDSKVNRSTKVKDLWDLFNLSAWQCADPAPQFKDTFNAWHTCPAGEDGNYGADYNLINSTNPCGEYAFLDDTSCNLASINVYRFYDIKNKTFDVEGYLHIVSLTQLLLEASIHWGQFPTEDIARKTHLFRTTGLGVANLASLFMVMGYPYDSDEARSLGGALVALMTSQSYAVSALMSKEIGPFAKYELNKQYMLRVIRNHGRTAGAFEDSYEGLNYTPYEVNHKVLAKEGLQKLSSTLKSNWQKAAKLGEAHGYRNAQVTVIAPTGTISFAMDCGATSIEPFFSHVVYKKLSGGGFMTVVNPVIEASLQNLGYSEEQIEDIIGYIMRSEKVKSGNFEYEKIMDGKIEGAPHLKEEHLPIFDTANKCGSGSRFIAPEGHFKMVAALTPVISGAISKTVNLPKDATVEDIKKITLDSWKLGIKGITIYRDSCKASQPLNTSLEAAADGEVALENLSYKELLEKAKEYQQLSRHSHRDKPVGIRYGKTHPAQIDDVKIYTTVNRNEDGEIAEIYITTDREGTIITGLLNSLSKSISVMLQYHVPPQDIARMLRGQKYEPYGFVQKHPYIKYVSSISDLISKIIDIEVNDYSRCQVKPEHHEETITKTSAAEGERIYGSTCKNCSSTRMVKNGTCMVCLDCGTTTGCS